MNKPTPVQLFAGIFGLVLLASLFAVFYFHIKSDEDVVGIEEDGKDTIGTISFTKEDTPGILANIDGDTPKETEIIESAFKILLELKSAIDTDTLYDDIRMAKEKIDNLASSSYGSDNVPSGLSTKLNSLYNNIAYRCIFTKTLYLLASLPSEKASEVLSKIKEGYLDKLGIVPVPGVPKFFTDGDIDVVNIFHEYYVFEDLPGLVERFLRPSIFPPYKIATGVPRGVVNRSQVCYAIALFQALANFYPLLGQVKLSATAPPEAVQFVTIMNELLTPSDTPLDLQKLIALKSGGADGKYFFLELLDSLRRREVVESGLDLMRLLNTHQYDEKKGFKLVEAAASFFFMPSVRKTNSAHSSLSPVFLVRFMLPKDVDKVLKLPKFPGKFGDEKSEVFELAALLCGKGHEVAYLRRADGTWYLADDSEVSPVSEDSLPLLKSDGCPASFAFYLRKN